MLLSAAYSDYLTRRDHAGSAATLADALEADGLALEASLLRAATGAPSGPVTIDVPGSPWNGRRAWLGERLPTSAGIGDLWFDPLELTPMLLVPRFEGPDQQTASADPFAWISLRPVAAWQYRAFLDLADIDLRPAEHLPFPTFDRDRLHLAVESDRATSLTSYEALTFAAWLGKSTSDLFILSGAFGSLDAAGYEALWPGKLPEWGGWYDEEEVEILTGAPFDLDGEINGWEKGPDDIHWNTVDNWTFLPDVGLRTGIDLARGLRLGTDGLPSMPSLGALRGRLSRSGS